MIITEERPGLSESADLLARARAGEADAYCELAQASEERLFRQAVALCHDPTTAEDLAAETLIEGWKSIARFDGSCRFSTWLYAILVHRFQKTVRRARSRPVTLAGLPQSERDAGESSLERLPDARPLPAENLVRQEQAARMRAAIDTLPPKHQEVVLLRFYEEASLSEIAAALGLSLGTVKSRLHHALEKLRKMKSLVNLLRP
ncbi:MAG: sigma-70 family RNA polymerase sigma factor [Verrucomicrobia bacterium]|nr:sigma-70 family RNA polymerase sigma factor [Verrucomicrobiota bacterium]